MVRPRFSAALPASVRARPLLFAARRFRFSALILLFAWPISGCYRWVPLPAPDAGFGRSVDHVRLRTAQGRELEVWYPQLRGDSLYGASTSQRRDSTDVRLGGMSTLQIRRLDNLGTALVIAGLVFIPMTLALRNSNWGAP